MRNDDMVIGFPDGRIVVVIDRNTVYDGPKELCPAEILAEIETFNGEPVVEQVEKEEQ